MSMKLRSWIALIIGVVLTIATSPPVDYVDDMQPLAERVLTTEDPYYPISGSIETTGLADSEVLYSEILLNLAVSVDLTETETVDVSVHRLLEAWTNGDELPSEDSLVSYDSWGDENEALQLTNIVFTVIDLESPTQDFHLLVVVDGDPSVTVWGHVTALVHTEFSLHEGTIPEDAEVRLTLE